LLQNFVAKHNQEARSQRLLEEIAGADTVRG
jgi:hypothetical protein